MKVGFVTPQYFHHGSYIGGGERYPVYLARAVAGQPGSGWSVEMVSFGDEAAEYELHPGVNMRILKAAKGKPGRTYHPLDVFSWDLPQALADCDIVHVHQVFTRCGEFATVVAGFLGKPIVVTDHGGTSSLLGRDGGIMEVADVVMCYSRFATTLLRTSNRVEVVPGGVDAEFFHPPDRPVERDRVLFVGRIMPHKGLDRLIEALPAGLRLTVCGRPYNETYYDDVQELARGKDVEFLTETSDEQLRDLYRRAWVTVLPSVWRDRYGTAYKAPELMGLTILESMACGTPAICARTAAMPEFVDHGVTGFVYDTPEELTAYLQRLAGEPGLAGTMGAAGRAAVDAEFALPPVGERMRGLYRSIVAA